jgi:methyl-accepting chemotaxis protein
MGIRDRLRNGRNTFDYAGLTPTPIVAIDRAFNVTFINATGARLLGRTPETCLGEKCYNLFQTPHCRTPECRLAQAMEYDGTFTGETVADPQGLNIPIRYTGVPLKDAKGRIVGALEHVVDISDLRSLITETQAEHAYLQGEVANLVAALERAGAGDLTVRLVAQRDDAVGQVVRAVNALIAQLRAIIGQVQASALQVAAASEQINAVANQSAQASQQVAATTHEVAQGAQEQARVVGGASRTVSDISAMIAQVSATAQASAATSQRAAEVAREGTDLVQRIVEAMAAIKESVSQVGGKVQQMQDHSAQIGVIVETVDDIAAQTNLLALNAAIEAARAGEQGRGFAVVADEVRRLAERSSQATKEIAGLIRSVQQGIDESVDAMDASLGRVGSGAELVNQAGEALGEILTAVEQARGQAHEIAAASQEMADASALLVQAMDNAAAIVEENTAAAQEVSATMEEMSAQAEEVTASSQAQAEMAQALQALVSQFHLGDGE